MLDKPRPRYYLKFKPLFAFGINERGKWVTFSGWYDNGLNLYFSYRVAKNTWVRWFKRYNAQWQKNIL